MSNNPISHLEQQCDAPTRSGRVGNYISAAWSIYQSDIAILFLYGVLVLVLNYLLGTFVFNYYIQTFITSVLLMPALEVGLTTYIHASDRNKDKNVSQLFSAFQSPKILQYMLFGAALFVLQAIGRLVFAQVTGEEAMGIIGSLQAGKIEIQELLQKLNSLKYLVTELSILGLGLILASMYVQAITMFVLSLILFYDLTFVQALQYSIRLVHKNFATVAITLLAAVGIGLLTSLFCCIGLYLIGFPMIIAIKFFLFDEITNLNTFEGGDKNDFSNHLLNNF